MKYLERTKSKSRICSSQCYLTLIQNNDFKKFTIIMNLSIQIKMGDNDTVRIILRSGLRLVRFCL